MTSGDWIALGGDLLVVVSLAVTGIVYRSQSVASRMEQVDAALAALRSVREGMSKWGDQHFGGDGYSPERAEERAQGDYDDIMRLSYYQNFRVPTEPLTSLVQYPKGGSCISRETMIATHIALWKLGIFNQLVQQQTQFNALYLSQAQSFSQPEREAMAKAARGISVMIHRDAIGDAGWYRNLMNSIDTDIAALEARRGQRWWERRGPR